MSSHHQSFEYPHPPPPPPPHSGSPNVREELADPNQLEYEQWEGPEVSPPRHSPSQRPCPAQPHFIPPIIEAPDYTSFCSPNTRQEGSFAESDVPPSTEKANTSMSMTPTAGSHSRTFTQDSQPRKGGLSPWRTTKATDAVSFEQNEQKIAFQKNGHVLGRGSFGEVILGMNPETGELLAIKHVRLPKRSGAQSNEQQQRVTESIEREIRIMNSLPPHPNIVRYVGTRRTTHSIYIVMEYVSGGSVEQLLKNLGRFHEQAVRMYAHKTLLGLEHLHGNGIVHQDIKGANVLVDQNGEVKLADFGCSRHLCNLLEGHHIVGTPIFLAPEVCRGEGVSCASDIWSFGCFVLQMCRDDFMPWPNMADTDMDHQACLYAIGAATASPPIPPHLSSLAKDFLSQCLALNPEDRPTATELLGHAFFTTDMAPHGIEDLSRALTETQFTDRSISDTFTDDGSWTKSRQESYTASKPLLSVPLGVSKGLSGGKRPETDDEAGPQLVLTGEEEVESYDGVSEFEIDSSSVSTNEVESSDDVQKVDTLFHKKSEEILLRSESIRNDFMSYSQTSAGERMSNGTAPAPQPVVSSAPPAISYYSCGKGAVASPHSLLIEQEMDDTTYVFAPKKKKRGRGVVKFFKMLTCGCATKDKYKDKEKDKESRRAYY